MEHCVTENGQPVAARPDIRMRLAARYLPEAEAVDMDKEKRP